MSRALADRLATWAGANTATPKEVMDLAQWAQRLVIGTALLIGIAAVSAFDLLAECEQINVEMAAAAYVLLAASVFLAAEGLKRLIRSIGQDR